jgi:Zn-dependent protease with chaperone function
MRRVLLALSLAGAFIGPLHAQDGIAVTPLSKWRLLAPEEQVNAAAAQQYSGLLAQAQEKGALVPANDPQVKRLRAIAQKLIPQTARWNPAAKTWKWEVNLLNSPQINAFCMPGGRVAFFTGILDKLNLSDDEIAAVMGHEMAHALREHGRERMAKAGATSIVSQLGGAALSSWLGIDPRLTGGVTDAAGQLLVLKFSRGEEKEADLVGLDIAARAGFDPRAGVGLWQKMAALDKRAPVTFLSTHPSGRDRIIDIEANLELLLPLYARTKGTTSDRLPPYRRP